MNIILFSAMMGSIGGLARGCVGVAKALSSKKKIKVQYYFATVVLAIIIGSFVGMIMDVDYKVSLLAGYAGTDLLEGIYHSFLSKQGVRK